MTVILQPPHERIKKKKSINARSGPEWYLKDKKEEQTVDSVQKLDIPDQRNKFWHLCQQS